MKQIICVAIFVSGCASSSAELQVSEPKALIEEPVEVGNEPVKETRWAKHFNLAVSTTTKDGSGIDDSCHWDLEFKRDGEIFRVSGGDSYPKLGPIITFEDHEAAIKKLACIMPAFSLNAETLQVEEVETLGCVAEVRKTLVDHHALVLPEEEVRAAAERDLDFMLQRATNNIQMFFGNVIPVPIFDDLREGQVVAAKGVEMRVMERSHIAGHECRWVILKIDDRSNPEALIQAKTTYCYSSKLFLHLSTSMAGIVEGSGPNEEAQLTYLIEEVQIRE